MDGVCKDDGLNGQTDGRADGRQTHAVGKYKRG